MTSAVDLVANTYTGTDVAITATPDLTVITSTPFKVTLYLFAKTTSGKVNNIQIDVEVCGLELVHLVSTTPYLIVSDFGDPNKNMFNFEAQFLSDNALDCPVYYELVLESLTGFTSYTDPTRLIFYYTTKQLVLISSAPQSLMTVSVRAYTQGIHFALRPFQYEVCGLE